MAFFAESKYKESYQDLGIIVDDYTDFDMITGEAYNTIQEIDNAIMYGVGRYELDMIREGNEVIYTEGMLDTIKDKISSIWDYSKNWISSVWDKFITWIESYIRGDKEFLQKYEKQLKENLKYLDKNFSKTYEYAKLISNPIMITNDLINDYKKKAQEVLDIVDKSKNLKDADANRTQLLAITTSVIRTLDDACKELDVDSRENVNTTWIKKNFNNIKTVLLMDTAKIKKILKDAVIAADEVSKKIIKKTTIDSIELSGDRRNINTALIAAYRMTSSKLSRQLLWLNKNIIKGIKGSKSDARSICRVILNASKIKESTFESYFNI